MYETQWSKWTGWYLTVPPDRVMVVCSCGMRINVPVAHGDHAFVCEKCRCQYMTSLRVTRREPTLPGVGG